MCGGNGAAPMLDFITRLTKALNAGKRRGYSEPQEINGETCWIQFAIKKENGLYVTYFYSIEEKSWQSPKTMTKSASKTSGIWNLH